MNKTITHAKQFLSDMELRKSNSEFDAERALHFIGAMIVENETLSSALNQDIPDDISMADYFKALEENKRLTAENEKAWAQIHAEIENEKRLEAERDIAMADLKEACLDGCEDFCRNVCANEGDLCNGCNHGEFWEYHGLQDVGGEEK